MKVELRSFHGDLCISFLHVVIDATDSFSRNRTLRLVCTGMVQAKASILGETETAPNSSTGSGQLAFPRADGVVSSFLPGIWKRSVPETSPCHGQAKQNGELDPRKVTMDCRERSRGIETSTELVSRQSQRIGSVRERLCTWAASAGSCERKPAVTDAAANPSVRGRAFAAGESEGIDFPVDSRVMRSLLRLSSADSSPRRAEVGSTGVVHDLLYTLLIVSYLFVQNISLSASLSRYSGEAKECYAKNRRKSKACCLLHT
jgi:hypothetical protein